MKKLFPVFSYTYSISFRNYSKKRSRRNTQPKRPYVPWSSAEVTKNILETVRQPYVPPPPPPLVRRTSETNPINHSYKDVGKFYTVPANDVQTIFSVHGLPKLFTDNTKTFAECAIMVRKPAVEIMSYMKMADYSKPANKYVLYGPDNAGKTMTIAHLLHYAKCQDIVVFHAAYVEEWFDKYDQECALSEKMAGMVEIPLVAALFLKNFQLQNMALLEKLDIRTSRDYQWNQRECTSTGSALMDIVNHGINRVKYASECIDALIYELKTAATNGKCKVLVTIDGFNAFFKTKTRLYPQDKSNVIADRVLLTQSMFEISKADWCNGAIVIAVGPDAADEDKRETFLPFYLLTRKGVEHLDPFVPIHQADLSEDEFNNLLDYYEDRRWIQSIGGREEIQFITNRRFGDVAKYCSHLW